MGGLHHGHAELIRKAKDSAKRVLVSIYVNPLQFSEEEDFDKYPRNLKQDTELALKYGANAIWIPSVKEIFPNGLENHFQIHVPEFLTETMCGANRKGHFDGVATIITHLLKLVKPEILVLGEKDWQQLIIIRYLINDLGLPIKIKPIATVRDNDGLAFSSRNNYLSDQERKTAIALPNTLQQASVDYKKGNNISLNKIHSDLHHSGLKIEYLNFFDPYKLEHVDIGKHLCLLAAAVHCGNTRLIDHIFLMSRKPIVAIDGPAGAGKSTVTKAFAKKLGLTYLDTGAMYRAVTLVIQQKNMDPKNTKEVEAMLKEIELTLTQSENGDQKIVINGHEVTNEIRSPEVTSFVSIVAAEIPVRKFLTDQQKNMGKLGGIVAEGRDIGNTVFPDAELKIFLNASSAERAKRRSKDLEMQGFISPTILELEKEITARDQMDMTREISPLIQAEDAIEVITDGMNIEEVIQTLVDLFRMKIPEEIWPSLS